MSKLFDEIRRRRILGTAALYLAGAWFTLEVGTTIRPILALPEWVDQALLYLLLAGLPVALTLSWFFDIGRKGVSRTDAAAADPAVPPAAATRIAPSRHSIAVLPFVNMSSHAEHEYFSDGMAEELLNSLAALPALKVAARTSSFAFKGKNLDIRAIAEQLGVRNVLEGSVRWAGARVRITAQLIEAEQGYHLWSQTYDREIEDIFAIQSEIAMAIADALKMRLGQDAAAALAPAAPTTSMEAYHCYLRGRHLWQRRGVAAIRRAIEEYRQAIELDPRFARAYAALASAYAVLPEHSGEPREQGFALARPLALKALELDPTLAEPHGVLSYIHFWLWEWEAAELAVQRALSLDAQDPQLHQWYCNLLNDVGRRDEALAQARTAHELDPVSPIVNSVLAFCHSVRGDDAAALRYAAIARELGAGVMPLAYVDLLAQLRAGAHAQAQASWTEAMAALGKDGAWSVPCFAALQDRAQLPRAAEALGAAQATGAVAPNIAFLYYTLLDLPDAAYAIANTKVADRSLGHLWLFLPEASALRADARFPELMRRMGLMDYWQEHGWPPHLLCARAPEPHAADQEVTG